MNDAREAILGRLTQTQPAQQEARAVLPGISDAAAAETSLTERFTRALERVSVTWELANNPVSARMYLATSLQADAVARLLTWEASHLPSPGLLDTLNVLGIETVIPALRAAPPRLRPQDPDSRGDLLRKISTAEVGIIAGEAGFADSGALAVRGGNGRPLLAACLPRRIIVLLPLSRVFSSVSHWLASVPTLTGPMLTLLTGPSQSLDLELIRAAGIHGPRLVHVVLVGESS